MTELIGKVASFDYTNWRGEKGNRVVVVANICWGSNEWHKEDQWILSGYDLVKGCIRHFALKDISNLTTAR